jgi:hypothetical protein
MSRASRHVELSLLLAVAPLFAACGPSSAVCVGRDGAVLAEECCDPGAACHVDGAHRVYQRRSSGGGHASSWSGGSSRSGSSGAARGGFGGHGGGHGGGGE